MATNYVAYYRVSTKGQNDSGLGLEAQRQAVKHLTENCKDCILAEFTEVASGGKDNRVELHKAIAHAKKYDAKLLIAKLDRLTRNAAFLFTLRDAKVKFVCCDMPEANELTISLMAVMADHERKLISQRTKAALAAKRERIKKGDYMNARKDADGNPTFMKPDKNGKYRLGNPNGYTDAMRTKGVEAIKHKAATNKNTITVKQRIAEMIKANAMERELATLKGKTVVKKISKAEIARRLNADGFTTTRGKEFNRMNVGYLYAKVVEGMPKNGMKTQ